MKRAGYYVEGRFFKDHFYQAHAKASYLSNEYLRPVSIHFLCTPRLNLDLSAEVFTCHPNKGKP